MTGFSVLPEPTPFPRWLGPFSPARGTRSGFRFHSKRPGTWVNSEEGQTFWPMLDCVGAKSLARITQQHWGGGRLLILPNGYVVKPLQEDVEVGERVLIGRITGTIQLKRHDGGVFDLGNPGRLIPGDPWPGPNTTGIECIIQRNGALQCSWAHPSAVGRDIVTEEVRGPDPHLAEGFRRAMTGSSSGRVRVTAHGHVITNREEWDGSWSSIYVGFIDPALWPHQPDWIHRGTS